jgi:hypothetical protein
MEDAMMPYKNPNKGQSLVCFPQERRSETCGRFRLKYSIAHVIKFWLQDRYRAAILESRKPRTLHHRYSNLLRHLFFEARILYYQNN